MVDDRAKEKMQMFARYFLNYIQTQVLELSGLKITLTVVVELFIHALCRQHMDVRPCKDNINTSTKGNRLKAEELQV